MNIDELKHGVVVAGPKWPEPIHVKKVDVHGDYVQLVATTTISNEPVDQMIRKSDLADLNTHTVSTDFTGEAWKIFLALESKRYRFASLYDPLLAMNTSKVDPLPHQIEAVYGYVLRMPKIRFLLAHDPGAGKTIMAGLIIKELKMRRLIRRILIVVPGHLKDQWSRELRDRFSETFTVISRSYMRAQYAENAWIKENQIITSIDFAKRDEILPSLTNSEFDLIVVDEAHKMSAVKYGEKTEKTSRYRLGEILSKNSEHLLFLTATPHRGDPENFRLFLDLLNPGFFKTTAMIKESLNSQDNPLFLRRIKEDMTDFDGNPLFVPRMVQTPDILLSDPEKNLYNDVSVYVKEQYDKALKSDKKRHIGFALLILQRRMASSTYALLRSLDRRKHRLEKMLEGAVKDEPSPSKAYSEDDLDDMSEEDRWKEEAVWETLSVAENRHELENETTTLDKLISQAQNIIDDENETKLSQLKSTLFDMNKENSKKKILIFTESKDTLQYIEGRIRGWGYSVNTIHGNMQLEERVKAEAVFKNQTQIMVATEAAGEGINLQFCHLMINYDLPWNPNRLEQRMGRIHRYGQQREVTVFNMVASDTREGQIMIKLFEKLDEIKQVMSSDKVFDVISEILPGKSLTQLLIDAAANARSQDEIIMDLDINVDDEYIAGIKDKLGDSLATKYIDYTGIKEMKGKALENKLIPKYTEELFKKAFLRAGGKLHTRKDGFIAIDLIPYEIKSIAGADDFTKRFGTLIRSYPKTTFDKETAFKHPDSDFVTFGHPLFEAVLYWIDKKFGHEMQRGATFLDPNGLDGYVVFQEGEIRDGTNQIVGKQLFSHFVDEKSGVVSSVQPIIIWDLKESEEKSPAPVDIDRIKAGVLEHVIKSLEEYNEELQKERDRQAGIKRKYGVESLSQSIRGLDNDLGDLQIRKENGENVDLVIRNKEEKKKRYEASKKDLEEAIKKEQNLTMSTPSFVGIIRIKPLVTAGEQGMQSDPDVEYAGMRVAMEFERSEGREPHDVSKENLGFDVRSGKDDCMRYIEVKARAGEGSVALSTNEWYQASQMGDAYYLYVVWNATKPGAKPIIIQNPANNLEAASKVVRYFVSPEEIRKKAQ